MNNQIVNEQDDIDLDDFLDDLLDTAAATAADAEASLLRECDSTNTALPLTSMYSPAEDNIKDKKFESRCIQQDQLPSSALLSSKRESKIPTPTNIRKKDAINRKHETTFVSANSDEIIQRQPVSVEKSDCSVTGASINMNGTTRLPAESRIPAPRMNFSKTKPSKSPTIPQAPRLHASRFNKREMSQEDPYAMAQADHVLKKNLRSSPETASSETSKRSPTHTTISQAPRLHQSRVNRQEISMEDPYSMAQADHVLRMALRNTGSPQTCSRKSKRSPTGITVPKAPAFHHSNRKQQAKQQPMQAQVFMAQSLDLLKKNLRSSPIASPNSPASPSKTIPQAPTFHSVHERKLPKSRDEMELESIQQSTTFKATPMPDFSSLATIPAIDSPNRTKATPTITEPFHFQSEDRAAHHKKPEASVDKEALDLEECKNKFKARPMPGEFKQQRHRIDEEASDSPTKSTTSTRLTIDEPAFTPFKARPIPQSTYMSPENYHSVSSVSSHNLPQMIDSVDLEATLHEQNGQYNDSSNKVDHLDGSLSTSSAEKRLRLEEYRRKKDEKRKFEQEEELRRREFHARPLPKSIQQQLNHRGEHEMIKKNTIGHADDRTAFTFHARPLPKSIALELQQRTSNNKRKPLIGEETTTFKFLARPLPNSTVPKILKRNEVKSAAHDDTMGVNIADGKKSCVNQSTTTLSLSTNKIYAIKSPNANKDTTDPQIHVQSHKGSASEVQNASEYQAGSMPALTERFNAMVKMNAKTAREFRAGARFDTESNEDSKAAALSPLNASTGRTTVSCESSKPTSYSQHPHSVKMFILICIVRLVNTHFIQSYFEADEYWQTLEPAYCAAYFPDHNDCSGLTWEWKRRSGLDVVSISDMLMASMLGPVRTYLSVLPTFFLYKIAQFFGLDSSGMIARGPMILNSIIVAASTDWCVWYSARWLQRDGAGNYNISIPRWCLFASLASWFNAYSLVRTLSNSQETCFLAMGVALLSPELLGNKNGKWSVVRAAFAFFIGGMSTAIRFTSVTSFLMAGVLLANRQTTLLRQLGYIIFPCGLFGALGIGIAMLVDRLFYEFWTVPFIGNIHFNVLLGNSSLYGTHPWHWYLKCGLPAVTGLLLPFLLADFCGRGSSSYGRRNLWVIVMSYVATLSLSAHKEFRFLHPILPLVCLLAGPRVSSVMSDSRGLSSRFCRCSFVFIFAVANFAATLYLGMLHQTAPISVNRKIIDLTRSGPGVSNTIYSIYFWTGDCHSTPLHSHLHSPTYQFETWSLDCSPICLTDPAIMCESERFAADPLSFVNDALCTTDETMTRVCDADGHSAQVCRNIASPCSHTRMVPDFVVTRSRYENIIRRPLEQSGLREVARFINSIQGLRVMDRVFGSESFDDGAFRHLDPMGMLDLLLSGRFRTLTTVEHHDQSFQAVHNVLEFSIDEMILFSRV
ncbi:hypothetical protein MPSEU_001074800 [Mayamaea pseudoterrestris]|nr:hypothetical protein MPSEU_001074800 [Mayamaea pseudoterrestris]